MAGIKAFSDGPRLAEIVKVSPASSGSTKVAQSSTVEFSVTLAKATPTMGFVVTPLNGGTAGGLNGCALGAAYCTTAGTLLVQVINPTGSGITCGTGQSWRVIGL